MRCFVGHEQLRFVKEIVCWIEKGLTKGNSNSIKIKLLIHTCPLKTKKYTQTNKNKTKIKNRIHIILCNCPEQQILMDQKAFGTTNSISNSIVHHLNLKGNRSITQDA